MESIQKMEKQILDKQIKVIESKFNNIPQTYTGESVNISKTMSKTQKSTQKSKAQQ